MIAGVRAPSILLLIGACLTGCGGCSGASEAAGPAASSTQRTEASGGGAAPEAAAPGEPGPPPVLRITGTPEPDRRVAIRVENRGTESAELRGSLGLQRLRGDRWEDARAASLELRWSCEDEAPRCVTLAPGAVLLPPEWLGTSGDAQCRCARCSPIEAGTYRFVATSCDGAHTIEGEPFELAR